MAYTITREQLGSINDVEMAFSTDKLLPAWDDIPDEFKRGNIYTELAEILFEHRPLLNAYIVFKPGFTDDDAPAALNRCAHAHLQSYGPKHQHKIAGVGYMISMVCTITLEEPASADDVANAPVERDDDPS